MEAAEIEPVGAYCGNPLGLSDAVDEHDQRMFACADAAGDLDGAGEGVDLLVQSFAAFGDVPMTLTAARAGADGRLLWSDPDPVAISRVEGPSRTATAAALSAATRRTAATVVIARADAWPDAIAGGPLASMMYASLLLTARDGLSLFYRDFGDPGAARTPVLCLGGLTRNSKDFANLAPHLAAAGRRVVCPDTRGRGQSDYDTDWRNYQATTYLDDIRNLLIALGHQQ